LYRDVIRTLRQVTDRRFARVLMLSLVLAAVVFVALVAAAGWTLGSFAVLDIGWIDSIIDVLGVLAFGVVAILLFPAFATGIQGIFLDDVAEAVEERWYPGQPEPRKQPWREILLSNLELAAVVLAVNLVLLPVYLALIFVPPLNLVLFYVVNGFLLGREYFEAVALRRMPPAAAKRARLRVRGHVWLGGALIAFMFSIPFLNLAAPALGTALMLHMFQRLRGRLGVDDESGGGGVAGGTVAGDPSAIRLGDGTRAMRAGIASVLLGGLIIGASLQTFENRDYDPFGPAKPRPMRITGLPEELDGQGQIEIWSRLGSPDLVRREGPARVWQYATQSCVLDLYLYEAGDDFEVIHHALRGRREREPPEPGCYHALIERARLRAGPTASASATSPSF